MGHNRSHLHVRRNELGERRNIALLQSCEWRAGVCPGHDLQRDHVLLRRDKLHTRNSRHSVVVQSARQQLGARAYAHTNSNAEPDTNSGANSGANSNTEPDADAKSDSYSQSKSDAITITVTYSHPRAESDTISDSNGHNQWMEQPD